jgi:hypothetical protein
MAHRGIREWTGEELSNAALGQNGFHILTGNSEITAASKGITYWIALKAVDGSAPVTARTYAGGDSFSTDGDYDGASNWITLGDGDIVYGAFDAVDINGTTKYIVAYIGK